MSISIFFDKKSCQGFVKDGSIVSDLKEKWFGVEVEGKLVLNVTEVSYLLLSNRARVAVGDKYFSNLKDFMEYTIECFKEYSWSNIVVYKDLRDRGRRVKVIDNNLFMMKDKHGDVKIVLVLEEKRPVTIEDISDYTMKSVRNNASLVLAIVSLQGEVTYYEVSRIEPM
ncbi:endonuclease [Thermogladius sp. 4427co]|uniref:endonuclease n=1 Tax=Thermogladius sp. 4427co TaxID=3450718 RepID=UPI003F793A0A